MKKYIGIILILGVILFSSCEDYLDQNTDELNTIDKVFVSRTETIKWRNGIFNDNASANDDHWYIQTLHSCDQIPFFWCDDDAINLLNSSLSNILKGQMSPDYANPAGRNLMLMYYKGIRHANLFLENVDRCDELFEKEKGRYIAEARFMRAMFHFWLLRLYGPIPIQETSVEVTADTRNFKRNTLEECVTWICQELDYAANNGLTTKEDQIKNSDELGFPTVGAALAMKARLLLMVASPLYNGNSQYANWKNNDGTPLLYTSYSKERWKDAADAAKVVMDMNLYSLKQPEIEDGAEKPDFMDIVDNYRSVTTVWNDEIIWGHPNTTQWWCKNAIPGAWYGWSGRHSVTLDLVNSFRMADGTKAPDVDEWFANKQFSKEDGNGTKANTFWMFLDREPRFYASLHFPNQYLSYAYPTTTEDKKWKYVDFWYEGESGNKYNTGDKNSSGFSVRKNIPMNHQSDKATSSDTWNLKIPFPEIRYAEILLIYCEAMNEYSGADAATRGQILPYLNQIRTRSGLPALEVNDVATQEAMREAIREERRIEFVFEANRFFDVRRWFIAHGPDGVMNQSAYGLDMSQGKNATDPAFFTKTKLQDRIFRLEHYFLPIPASEVKFNTELVQAPFY